MASSKLTFLKFEYFIHSFQWAKLPINFKSGSTQWNFVAAQSNPGEITKLPPTLRIGDFDFDGHPDLLTVLTDG